jgi:multisubunit Na+/H+ antiporter MnhE subunit
LHKNGALLFLSVVLLAVFIASCITFYVIQHKVYVAVNILGIITAMDVCHFLFDPLFSTSLTIICPHTAVNYLGN